MRPAKAKEPGRRGLRPGSWSRRGGGYLVWFSCWAANAFASAFDPLRAVQVTGFRALALMREDVRIDAANIGNAHRHVDLDRYRDVVKRGHLAVVQEVLQDIDVLDVHGNKAIAACGVGLGSDGRGDCRESSGGKQILRIIPPCEADEKSDAREGIMKRPFFPPLDGTGRLKREAIRSLDVATGGERAGQLASWPARATPASQGKLAYGEALGRMMKSSPYPSSSRKTHYYSMVRAQSVYSGTSYRCSWRSGWRCRSGAGAD